MKELRVESKWTFKELGELYQVSDVTMQNRCNQYDIEKVEVGRTYSWKIASNKNPYAKALR